MTKEYACKMWKNYLLAMRKSDKMDRVIKNPAIDFAHDVKNGLYNNMPDDVYEALRDSTSQENAQHFHSKMEASACALTIYALQSLHFTKANFTALVNMLAEISAQSYAPGDGNTPTRE